MTAAAEATKFITSLTVPTGPKAGRKVKLAPFQKSFIRGALAKKTTVAVLCVARGAGKSTLSAGLAVGALLGVWDPQPRREIVLAARTRDQARICWDFCSAFARTLPEDIRQRLTFRKAPRLEIEYVDNNGPHLIKALAAEGKNNLGGASNLAILDERGSWNIESGDELENAIITGLGKRNGRAILISTSAQDDAHPFSRWLDAPPVGTFVQEHRPLPNLPPDDLASLHVANPGCAVGVGPSEAWLLEQARRSIERGGNTLAAFRNLNRNERCSAEARAYLLHAEEWLRCECEDPPPREGPCVVAVDLGGSASMSASAYYWHQTGRLEARGWFPNNPNLLQRGQNDAVNTRYCEMQRRGELSTLGDQTVPVSEWLIEVFRHVEGQQIAAFVADRFKSAEISEGLAKAGVRAPVIWRGMGFRDGGEDTDRLRRAAYDGKIKSKPSLLLRSAFGDCVTVLDPAANSKIAKARSNGRIDAACATTLAVAEGARIAARPVKQSRGLVWA